MQCIATAVLALLALVSSATAAAANEGGADEAATITSPYASFTESRPGSAGSGGGGSDASGAQDPLSRDVTLGDICGSAPIVAPAGISGCYLPVIPPVPGDPGYDLALRLRSQLTITMPGIHTAPPLSAAAIVGLPTWLWVDDSATRTLSATASEGPLTVTITAKPLGVDFDTGDGGHVHCAGNGSPYVAGVTDPHTKPVCSHTYTQRSTVNDPRGTFTLRASITYAISWSASTGQGGPLPATSVSGTTPIAVHELQATLD